MGGLIYFVFHRFKYSNKNKYIQNLEKKYALQEEILIIEHHKYYMEKIISDMDADMYFDEKLTDELINYKNNIDKLKILKFEYRKINLFLKNSRFYFKDFFYEK